MGAVLSFGLSRASSSSIQEAEANIAQRYQGTCNIRCDNAISDVNLVLIGTDVRGDVAIRQECTLDGQCLFNNSMDAVSDVGFAATNSSNAKNAASGVLSTNLDFSSSHSRQTINQNVNQAISNLCDLSSSNTMNNINMFAANSNIGGNVLFTQKGDTRGQCTFESLMSAATMASATATNTAESGKDKKGGSLATIASVIGVVVLLIVFGILARQFAGEACPDGSKRKKCEPGSKGCGADGYRPCKDDKKNPAKPSTMASWFGGKKAEKPKKPKPGEPRVVKG